LKVPAAHSCERKLALSCSAPFPFTISQGRARLEIADAEELLKG
jgi:hypothetical protein